jgi:hypothetical protein
VEGDSATKTRQRSRTTGVAIAKKICIAGCRSRALPHKEQIFFKTSRYIALITAALRSILVSLEIGFQQLFISNGEKDQRLLRSQLRSATRMKPAPIICQSGIEPRKTFICQKKPHRKLDVLGASKPYSTIVRTTCLTCPHRCLWKRSPKTKFLAPWCEESLMQHFIVGTEVPLRNQGPSLPFPSVAERRGEVE